MLSDLTRPCCACTAAHVAFQARLSRRLPACCPATEATAVSDNESKGASTLSTLTFFDLAGSERGASVNASRLKEGANINKSLSSLGEVIMALTSGNRHVPWRNSKFTMLLANAMCGIISVIVAVSPAGSSFDETVASLRLGQRFGKVRNSPPTL